MARIDVRWLAIFADVPVAGVDHAMRYWSAVTGARRGVAVGDQQEHRPLEPPDGDRYVWVQRVDRAEPGWHLDLYVPELAEATAVATSLGAVPRARGEWWVVCESPGGQPFCLVREYRDRRTRPAAPGPAGARSEIGQVCFDVPDACYPDEVEFWSELTGWPQAAGDGPELRFLRAPPVLPLRILVQRLGVEDRGGIRAHADLSADDPAAEVARHVALGATVRTVDRHWTVLRDPVGLTYCVTDRQPH